MHALRQRSGPGVPRYLVPGRVQMAPGGRLVVEDGRGVVLHLREGAMRVLGRPREVRAGERVRVTGDLLASAATRVVFALTAPSSTGGAKRVAVRRPGSAHPEELYAS